MVTWTFDDGSGNVVTQTQDIVIDDITAPVADIASLPDITDPCSAASLTAPTASDNCAGAITGTTTTELPITTSGTTMVTWTYDDGNGNTSTQMQNIIITPVDNSISQSGGTLTATANGLTYQWIDCSNGNAPISGATSQSFSPGSDGSFAVEITSGNCTVTSECIDVMLLAASNPVNNIEIYPNPTAEFIHVHLLDVQPTEIKLLSLVGKTIKNFGVLVDRAVLRIADLQSGIYILQLDNGERVYQQTIIKK